LEVTQPNGRDNSFILNLGHEISQLHDLISSFVDHNRAERLNTVQLFLDLGSHPGSRDVQGHTPFDVAEPAAQQLFVQHEMKCKEIGRCVMERDEPGMKLLKARGVSLLSRNVFGLNALELSDLFHGPGDRYSLFLTELGGQQLIDAKMNPPTADVLRPSAEEFWNYLNSKQPKKKPDFDPNLLRFIEADKPRQDAFSRYCQENRDRMRPTQQAANFLPLELDPPKQFENPIIDVDVFGSKGSKHIFRY
jgi:hypothetical protein